MATAKKIQSDISSLKVAIRVAKNDAIKKKLKSRLEMAENELASIKSGAKPRKVSTTKGTKSLLERAKALVKKNPKFSRYKGSGVDLEKDAKEGARETGRRVSKGIKGNQYASKEEAKGNVYYEYRVNRLDVKQPKKKQTYPKLEDGGYMADGGIIKPEKPIEKMTKLELMRFVGKVNPTKHFYPTTTQAGKIQAKEIYEEYLERKKGKMADGGYMAKGGWMRKHGLRVGDLVKYELMDEENTILVENKNDKKEYLVDLNKGTRQKKFEWGHMADGGYMAKGGWMRKHGLRVGDLVKYELMDEENTILVENKNDKKEYLVDLNKGTRQKKFEWGHMADGGYMAKGGMTEHGLQVGDMIIGHYDNNVVVKDRSNKIYLININNGTRLSEEEFDKLGSIGRTKFSKMAHGGETHRADDPEVVEIDEDEMKVVRGYSDDEAYEYAKGGMTLKAGDIVEATTGVKLKVMDFKPDFGGRALVQRIDEFGEGLKPAWMPLTKFKLPKLI